MIEKPEKMVLLTLGTSVKIGQSNVKGVIRQICLAPNYAVQYECTWWNGGERYVAWFESYEVEPMDGSTFSIGFKP